MNTYPRTHLEDALHDEAVRQQQRPQARHRLERRGAQHGEQRHGGGGGALGCGLAGWVWVSVGPSMVSSDTGEEAAPWGVG